MRFRHVQLAAGATCLNDQRAFYEDTLGLRIRTRPEGVSVDVGETELEFLPHAGEPFYHFALLVPGDRFSAAQRWIAARVRLLPHADRPDVVFHFPDWSARACYFHDPAGNIVELIAHGGLGENHRRGQFSAGELIGLSELGLVGRPTAMAPPLTDQVHLSIWDGRVADHGGLAFVGAKGRTLILVPTGRGWLPTGRPAQRHPVTALIAGPREGQASLEGGLYRVTQAAAPR